MRFIAHIPVPRDLEYKLPYADWKPWDDAGESVSFPLCHAPTWGKLQVLILAFNWKPSVLPPATNTCTVTGFIPYSTPRDWIPALLSKCDLEALCLEAFVKGTQSNGFTESSRYTWMRFAEDWLSLVGDWTRIQWKSWPVIIWLFCICTTALYWRECQTSLSAWDHRLAWWVTWGLQWRY